MLEERLNQSKKNKLFLAGERLPGIKFRHNSQIRISSGSGEAIVGWVVAVNPLKPEPIYTIEREDREPDIEAPESAIELLFDPHEHK